MYCTYHPYMYKLITSVISFYSGLFGLITVHCFSFFLFHFKVNSLIYSHMAFVFLESQIALLFIAILCC